MKPLLFGLAVIAATSIVSTGCGDRNQSKPLSAADAAAGRLIAQQHCQTCHGMDGRGIAAGIPHLAGQRAPYMLASVKEYAQGWRTHTVLRELMGSLSDADVHNVVAFYAGLAPIANAPGSDAGTSHYEQGKRLAAACAQCHGEDGNSKTPGTPTLAGQQPQYLAAAIQEYHQGNRVKGMPGSMLPDTDRLELENLALYFAAQTPVRRAAQSRGDAATGALLSVKCGGCHGSRGVSTDTATPSLAGQDSTYLVNVIRSYRASRRNWGMQRYVAGLDDRNIDDLVAFYAAQTPKAADPVPGSTQEMAEKCDRCHDRNDNPGMAAPSLRSQDRDYLAMALRAYRDGRRESATMHNTSFAYSNAVIASLANWYAGQPAR